MGGWRPREGAAIGIALAPDALGAGLAALVALLVAAALLVSRAYFATLGGLFQALLLVFLGAAAGLCTTADLFNFYVFFELVGVTGFVLTAYRMRGGALHGAFAFAVTNSIAGLLLLTGIGVLYAVTGSVNMAELSRALPQLGDVAPVRLAFALVMAGLLVKAASVPFQFWLADAYAAAAAPVCVLFGGASVTLGVFGIARLSWTVFAGEDGVPPAMLGTLLLPLGLATAVLGAAFALVEHNLKRLLALTTVSHVGVLLVALGMATPPALAGASAYLLGHGLVKAALFAAAAVLALRFGSTDTAGLGGAAASVPATTLLLALGGLLLAGLPIGAIHAGKEGIVAATAGHGVAWAGPVLLAAAAASGAAVLRAAGELCLRQGAGSPPPPAGGHAGGALAIFAIGAALTAGAAATGVLGVEPPLADAAESFAQPGRYAAAVLDDALVPHLGHVPEAHGEDGLASKLLPPIAAVTLAALLLRRRVPGAGAGSFLALPLHGIERLHALHTGRVGDYVAWLVAGSCVIGITCTVAPWR